MFVGYRHLSIDYNRTFGSGKIYINGIEGFWSFAKERMAKHNRLNPGKFLLYIKKMEWIYNNINNNTFTLLVDYMFWG